MRRIRFEDRSRCCSFRRWSSPWIVAMRLQWAFSVCSSELRDTSRRLWGEGLTVTRELGRGLSSPLPARPHSPLNAPVHEAELAGDPRHPAGLPASNLPRLPGSAARPRPDTTAQDPPRARPGQDPPRGSAGLLWAPCCLLPLLAAFLPLSAAFLLLPVASCCLLPSPANYYALLPLSCRFLVSFLSLSRRFPVAFLPLPAAGPGRGRVYRPACFEFFSGRGGGF